MTKLKRYAQFINENLSEDLSSKITDKFKDIKTDFLELVAKSIKTESLDLIKSFLEDYVKEDSKSSIEGLVNDADIYQFYIKYTNDMDEILEQSEELKKSPIDKESFGLYDYVVKQTRTGLKDIAKQVLSDLESEQEPKNETMFWKRDKQKGKIVVIANPVLGKNGIKSTFVYQLLEKVGDEWKAVLIGDIKSNSFQLWLGTSKKLGSKVITKKFIFENIKTWIEPTEQEKNLINLELNKIKELGGREDFISVRDIIKKITKVEPVI